MWTQLGTTKTVVGTARGRVYVDSTWDSKDSSRDSQGYRVRVDSTGDNKDSSRDTIQILTISWDVL